MAATRRTSSRPETDSPHQQRDVFGFDTIGKDGRLRSGALLPVGCSVHAPHGMVALVMQADGNLVLYARRSGGAQIARWSSCTKGQAVTACRMQTDGNLVLYNGTRPVWATGSISPGAHLQVQDDEDLVIYHGTTPVWAAYTSLDGTPVKGADGDVFYLLEGVRHRIPDEETLNAEFGGWGAVTTVLDDALDRWPEGEPVALWESSHPRAET